MTSDRIEKQVLLHAPLDRVWKAISDSSEFGHWFGMKFDGPFVAGSPICGELSPTTVDERIAALQRPHAGLKFEFLIGRIEPEKSLAFYWHPFAVDPAVDYSAEPCTLILFELEPVEDGVRLTVTESGFDRIPAHRREQAYAANDGGWAMQMTLIEKYLRAA